MNQSSYFTNERMTTRSECLAAQKIPCMYVADGLFSATELTNAGYVYDKKEECYTKYKTVRPTPAHPKIYDISLDETRFVSQEDVDLLLAAAERLELLLANIKFGKELSQKLSDNYYRKPKTNRKK